MRLAVSLFLLFPFAAIQAADEIETGDRVRVRSDNPGGVPLHREHRSSMFARLPNGSVATVEAAHAGGRWLEVTGSGHEGWIIDKYVEDVVEAAGPGAWKDQEARVWSSRDECEAVMLAGGGIPNPDDVLRIGSWNIRWFPDGVTGTAPETEKATDVAWAACAIAWMNVDVLALQEIKRTPRADMAMDSLLDGLSAFTGEEWQARFMECGYTAGQRVGYLWNASRVSAANFRDAWRLNGAAGSAGEPCHRIRPGHYGYFESTVSNGADVHLFAVHLDSGRGTSDREHRDVALQRISAAIDAVPENDSDSDVIVLGDFNTMGVTNGDSAEEEIAAMDALLDGLQPRFERPSPVPACTEFYGGSPNVLDHIAWNDDFSEAADAGVTVTGYCAMLACEAFGGDRPAAYRKLSDHCPLFVDIDDRDID